MEKAHNNRYSFLVVIVISIITLLSSCREFQAVNSDPPHIVFVMGDEEYRSEESMPMLANLLQQQFDAEISLCFSTDSAGYIDPNRTDHIANLESLETADLLVLFTRFRALPDDELKMIVDYVEGGGPVVGFRTSTHAFKYREDSTKFYLNDKWPAKVFGQQWITHHGHFADGDNPLTKVEVMDPARKHPILAGIKGFDAYSWLYHVDGGKWALQGDCEVLLQGTSLRSNHAQNNRLDQYPLTNPVAWTKTYMGSNATEPSRVFFTTLGHPFDFKDENMRKLAIHGIMWALKKEDKIPSTGVDCKLNTPYNPSNSGFGQKYKKGVRPEDFKT